MVHNVPFMQIYSQRRIQQQSNSEKSPNKLKSKTLSHVFLKSHKGFPGEGAAAGGASKARAGGKRLRGL